MSDRIIAGSDNVETWEAARVRLRARGKELEERLASRTTYETLRDAIGACHEVSDLLSELRSMLIERSRPEDAAFLSNALDHGFGQVNAAMGHGYEVYGQELDPMKYRLRVAVAIARYAADRLT